MSLELRDARRSPADREWLTNVFPFYLHDLSEFDLTYYTLDDRGVWRPDHLPSWLEEDGDHPLIVLESGRRVGFALVTSRSSTGSRASGRSPSCRAIGPRSPSGAA